MANFSNKTCGTDMATILNHFDALTDKGLKIIPLRHNSKIPLCKGWTKKWDKIKVREKIRQFPDSNLGILLGDIVDVEGDSEEANREIIKMIGDYPHPSYHSTKSIHHLFLSPDSKLTHFRFGEIEFRGHGHQSVVPPSQHQGIIYRWLRNFKFPVPEMPEELRDFYSQKRKRKVVIKQRLVQIRCGSCEKNCHLHKKRLKLEIEAFKVLGSKWKCQHCRSVDLRQVCRIIRGKANPHLVLANALIQS